MMAKKFRRCMVYLPGFPYYYKLIYLSSPNTGIWQS